MFKGLSGAALVPLAITVSKAEPMDEAYAASACQCVKCLHLMPYSNPEPYDRPYLQCVNHRCEMYEIRYKAPRFQMDRA